MVSPEDLGVEVWSAVDRALAAPAQPWTVHARRQLVPVTAGGYTTSMSVWADTGAATGMRYLHVEFADAGVAPLFCSAVARAVLGPGASQVHGTLIWEAPV